MNHSSMSQLQSWLMRRISLRSLPMIIGSLGPIKVGFKFPFYGKDYDEIYVSSYGGVSMQQMDGPISCMVPTGDCVQGLGYISAYTNSGWMDTGANSKITYGHKNGKLYIKFKDVVTPATDGAWRDNIPSASTWLFALTEV